jgi:hypothetical protein
LKVFRRLGVNGVVSEATGAVGRTISDLHRRPNETKAAEALVETFQAAAHAMARHQQSMEQQLRNLDTAKG